MVSVIKNANYNKYKYMGSEFHIFCNIKQKLAMFSECFKKLSKLLSSKVEKTLNYSSA